MPSAGQFSARVSIYTAAPALALTLHLPPCHAMARLQPHPTAGPKRSTIRFTGLLDQGGLAPSPWLPAPDYTIALTTLILSPISPCRPRWSTSDGCPAFQRAGSRPISSHPVIGGLRLAALQFAFFHAPLHRVRRASARPSRRGRDCRCTRHRYRRQGGSWVMAAPVGWCAQGLPQPDAARKAEHDARRQHKAQFHPPVRGQPPQGKLLVDHQKHHEAGQKRGEGLGSRPRRRRKNAQSAGATDRA